MKSVIAVLLLICIVGGCSEKPGKEAYLALKKVEAKANANAYLGYQKAYREAAYEIDKFIKIDDKKMEDIDDGTVKTSVVIMFHAATKLDMIKIKHRYYLAGILWKMKNDTMDHLVYNNSQICDWIIESFPKIIDEAIAKQHGYRQTFDNDELRKLLWRDASLELKKMSKQYK